MKTLLQSLVIGGVLGLGGFGGAPAVASESRPEFPCYRDVCVGDRAMNLDRDYREVTVIAIDPRLGKFVIRYEDNGSVGGNWDREDLALMRGCAGDLCVGYPAFNLERNFRRVKIAAIQFDGRFVLRYDDSHELVGKGDRWDLAVAWGCVDEICVNDTVFNPSNGRMATIAAVQSVEKESGSKLVLAYSEGEFERNRDRAGLVLLAKGPTAYPPNPNYPCPIGTHWDPRVNRCVFDAQPIPPGCPNGSHWDPRSESCVRNTPPPPPSCPWGTHWDPRTNRCVSNTPPLPPPPPRCPSGTHWDPRADRCVPNTPVPPPSCPPGTHWETRENRCVQNRAPNPVPPPVPPPSNPRTPPQLCPPGTHWDPRANRCA